MENPIKFLKDSSSKCWASLTKTQYEAKRAKPVPGMEPPRYKYLGLTLNYNLRFEKHIRNTLQKARGPRVALYPMLNPFNRRYPSASTHTFHG